MNRLALAAALILTTLATSAAAQSSQARGVVRLTIITGDDDLRGGRDNVRGSYRSGATWSAPRILNLRGARWADRSRNVAQLDVPIENLRAVNAVRLQTTFRGGVGGDNWNMDQLYIEFCLVGEGEQICSEVARHGPRRFTAERGELIVPITLPEADSGVK